MKKHGLKSRLLHSAILIASAQLTHAAMAQDGRTLGALEEVIVTAQKRSQSQQDVGIAITAVTGDQMRALGLSSSVDIAQFAPNVAVSGSYGGLMSQFTIRGVTQNDFNDHVESVIATYVDDTYIAMQQGQTFTTFDIDRIEVLKGPQGTLFGRNATGGLAHFVTKRPTDEFEGYIDSNYGSFDELRMEGAIGGPITSSISGRISGLYHQADGYIRNGYPGQTFTPENDREQGGSPASGAGADLGGIKSNEAVRAQLVFEISDTVELWTSVSFNDLVGSSAPYQMPFSTVAIQDAAGNHINTLVASPNEICQVIQEGACIPGYLEPTATRVIPGANFLGYTDPDGIGLKTSSDYAFDDGGKARTWSASSKLTADLGGVNLTWISDYKDFTKDFLLDLTGDPANSWFWIGESEENTLSQELRFDGATDTLDWVAGLYYLKIDNQSVHGLGALPNSSLAVDGEGYDIPRVADLQSESYSAFGQFEHQLSDTLTVIGGLRVSRELKDYNFETIFVPTTIETNRPKKWDYAGGSSYGTYENDDDSDTLWNWKAQVNWRPYDDDFLVYAGVTQGSKAGSFNSGDASLLDNDGAAIPYKPEKLISYEAGFKTSVMDERLRFNASAFYYDYKDYQAAQWGGLSSIIINADAYFYGVETEIIGSVTPNLDVSFNVGWQQNTVKDVPVGAGVADRETTFAPEWTVSGLARYTYPEYVFGGLMSFQASGSYQSAVWHNLNNFDANRLPSYTLVDARISWVSADDRFTVAVFGKNIFDERYDTIGFDEAILIGGSLNAPGKPERFGVNFAMNF